MYIDGVNVCANLGVEVSKKMCHQSTAKTLAQKNQKKKKKKKKKVSQPHWITFSFGFASDSRRKPVQCQWKAIALPSSSWYRKAYGVVVHWRCWLVQAIPRHQAQVSFRITLHACHDCTDATSKLTFQFRRQPFHTFQRSTKTHRQLLLVFAAAASGTSLWASRPQEQSGHPQWFLTSPHDPGAVWSSAVRLTSPRSSFVNWRFPSSLLTATVTFNFERVFLSSGSRGKEKKKTTRPNPAVL